MPSPANSKPGWIRRLYGYVRGHRTDLRLAVGASLIGIGSQTLVPLVERQVVDRVIVQHSSPLLPWLSLLIGLAALSFAMSYIRRYRGGRVALGVQFDLRNAMHDHLQELDFDNLGRMPTGQLVARANSDSALVQGLLSFLPIMMGNVLLMLLSLSVMLVLSPQLALVSLVVAPALLFTSYRMRRRVFPATWDAQQREGDVAQIVDEAVNGVRIVKAFGQEARELGRLSDAAQTLYGSQMRAVRLQSRYQPFLEAIPTLGQVAILAFGGWLALRHEITIGTFLAFSTYIAQLISPARQLAGLLTIGQQARAGVERIFQLLDTTPAIASPDEPLALGAFQGDIEFQSVTFSYGGSDAEGSPALNRLSLKIRAGERVALVGASGSGKTTLCQLVPRFYDPGVGSVLIDGRDVRQVDLKELRSKIAFVFEESFLFSDTIEANIAYSNPRASASEIRAAAKVAEADEFISQLPDGYQTVVGERGLTLSGGQRQRIALARAVLSDAPILILDGATSAVDVAVEERIQANLRAVMSERTTIIVAHRLSTLSLADRIVVLEHGQIVEEGTESELAERSELFRTLVEVQGPDVAAPQLLEDAFQLTPALATTTSSAWSRTGGPGAARTSGGRNVSAYRAPSIGSGLGGGGGGWRMNLAPTPELLARVAALRPIKDRAELDLQQESAQTRDFGLKRILADFRRPLLFGLSLVFLDALLSLAGPVLVKTGIDGGVSKQSEAVLFAAAGIFLIVALVDLLDQVAETFVTGRTAQRIMLSLRLRIFGQLQRLSLDYYESEMAGRIMTRMTTDVDQFESLMENGLLAALVAGFTFVGVGVALIVINWRLGLATLSVVLPLSLATVAFRRRAARLYALARERISIVNADFQESLAGVRESQAYCHEEAAKARFHALGQDYLTCRIAAQRLVATYFPFVQFLSAVAAAIVLGLGSSLVSLGELRAGGLIAFILYIDMFFSPIQQLSQVFDSWQQTRVSVRRVADLMSLGTRTPVASAPVRPGRLSGHIRIRDVHFAYPTSKLAGALSKTGRGPADPVLTKEMASASRRAPEAIRGIDLEIRPGETVALVGQTGAGKSTLVKLLARFYDPDSGEITVDGFVLAELDLGAYRSQLGYVPQESFLFSGTIRDNIAYGRPDATDAEVEGAARATGAHEFITQLKDGYLHEVTERGRSLSAGQRQLIALARAELVQPAILLLDEATSNLDLATEAQVAAAMRRVSAKRTTVLIAHRLQSAQMADRIVVLSDGQIAEVGSHDELLAAGGRYSVMWSAFRRSLEEPGIQRRMA
jgi:ATP-binding cassette subfamily B protein